MFSMEEANYLIGLPKTFEEENIGIDILQPKLGFNLSSPEDSNYNFRLEIQSSNKVLFKINIHHREKQTSIGLLRLDYKGIHNNPVSINSAVPQYARAYVGYRFENEPHMHIYVEGYPPLNWAVPLQAINFPTTTVNNNDDFNEAILHFTKKINIVSRFSVIRGML